MSGAPRLPLRDALSLSVSLVEAQTILRAACRRTPGTAILVESTPRGVDVELRTFRVVDRTGPVPRTLWGPVGADGVHLLAAAVAEGAWRWTAAHARRRSIRVVTDAG